MAELVLSIIVPLYNGGRYITDLINSIFTHNNEDTFPFEIILVNDGSKDNTSEVCQILVSQYSNIRYIEKENGGIASARNVGLAHAAGKYITFADQDDVVLDGYQKFIDRCINEDLDMLITSPYNKNTDNPKLNQRIFPDQTITDKTTIRKIAGKLIDGAYLSDETAPFVSTSVWNVLYKRETLLKNDIHFKVFVDYEDDWIFNIENLLAAEKIGLSSEGYYCWIIRGSSESHRTKYIPELLNKRKNWMNWMSGIVDAIGAESEKAEIFRKDVLIPRNIMMCFNNACWHEGVSREERLQEIQAALSPEGWDVASVDLNTVMEMSSSNKFLLKLLKSKHVNLAYFLNRNVLKNRFH